MWLIYVFGKYFYLWCILYLVGTLLNLYKIEETSYFSENSSMLFYFSIYKYNLLIKYYKLYLLVLSTRANIGDFTVVLIFDPLIPILVAC